MKKYFTLIFTILYLTISFGQTDKHGNPIFNSITTNEISFDHFLLHANYYTLNNNIENKLTSVFISEKPTLDQIEFAATTLPSDFFLLTNDRRVVAMVMLQNYPKMEFMSMELRTGKQSYYTAKLKGDITENRAKEIIEEKFDANAKIQNGILSFNNKEFKIIPNKEIELAVLALIKKEKLDKKKPSEIILRSKKEIKDYIISSSQEGGELDFFTEIKGKEYDGVQIKPGVFTTKQSIALYKWGRACFEYGVNTVEDAYEIFTEIKGKPVHERELEYIRMGFYKEWEK